MMVAMKSREEVERREGGGRGLFTYQNMVAEACGLALRAVLSVAVKARTFGFLRRGKEGERMEGVGAHLLEYD